MRLLSVEDERVFADALIRHLMREGHVVDWIRTGAAMADALAAVPYSAAILDMNLPDAKGEDLLRRARSVVPGLPILIVSARASKLDRLAMLDLGADDYLVKPVDLDEVSARLRAISRRQSNAAGWSDEIHHGPLSLNPTRRTASWFGKTVPLTNKEYRLLDLMISRRGRLLSRGQIEEALYGWSDEIESNAIEVYVHHLRRKFSPDLIVTQRGMGYSLGAPEMLHGVPAAAVGA